MWKNKWKLETRVKNNIDIGKQKEKRTWREKSETATLQSEETTLNRQQNILSRLRSPQKDRAYLSI